LRLLGEGDRRTRTDQQEEGQKPASITLIHDAIVL
jgi:hypothetical protein